MTDNFEPINKAMSETLYLEPDDIAANRSGTITQRQKDRIHGQLRSAYIGMGCVGFLSILPAIIVLFLLDTTVFQAIVIIGIVAWVFLAIRTARDVNRRRAVLEQDLANDAVSSLEGELGRKSVKRTMYVGIDDKWFVVPNALYDAVPEGETATIYYLPESKQFLSLESTG
jgi:hypothetical protein